MVSHMVSPDSGDPVTQDRAAVLASAEALLHEEFGQSWQHFRHLETMRGQYLAFAFTVTLASLAASIPLVAGVDEIDGTTLLPAGVFVLLYCLVIGFLYPSTDRTYTVLGWRLFRLQTTSESILVAFLAIGGVAEAACTGGLLTLAHTWFAWVQRDDEFSSQVHQ